jgi:hypothetical protein
MPSLTLGQASAGQGKDDKVREELRELHSDYQEAGSKRARAALERIFAEGYVWVHGNGNITGKAQHLDNILGNTSRFSAPAPSFDQLTVYFEEGTQALMKVRDFHSWL